MSPREQSRRSEAESGPTVLVVDDEATVRAACRDTLAAAGIGVQEAASVPDALTKLEQGAFEIVLSDVCMPGLDGLQLLRMVRDYYPFTSVVMMTGHATVQNAVEAMKMGAADFLTKPVAPDDLVCRLARLLERRALEFGVLALRAQMRELGGVGRLKGVSTAMQHVFEFIMRAAAVRVPVLIQGESGTGKELVARAIRENGPGKERPFVTVDCGALPESLIERELFGHVKGAFTDAREDHPGLLASAKDGTLFLDEIGELPVGLQSKLLRVVQEKEYRPLGGTRYQPFPARIVAATNRDLKQAQAEGRFRPDLYYRLNVLSVQVPPLRERVEDTPILAQYFLEQQRESGMPVVGFSQSALRALTTYQWPGNVRELENAVVAGAICANAPTLDVEHLPADVRHGQAAEQDADGAESGLLRQMEKKTILEVLARTGGDRRKAAAILGISRASVYAKVKEYGADS